MREFENPRDGRLRVSRSLFISLEQIVDSTLRIHEYPSITNPRANRRHVSCIFFVPDLRAPILHHPDCARTRKREGANQDLRYVSVDRQR